jgi:CheY-like chemotaxis protein
LGETRHDGRTHATVGASHILLVEDSEDDAELIGRAFQKAHIANPVELAPDGDAAIRALEARVGDLPVLVLLDLKLPRRSGFEVLEWIRGNPATRRLPVVVLTSSRQTTDVDRAYDLGANSYLVKPVKSDALVEMVRTLNLYWLVMNEPGSPAVAATSGAAEPAP